MLTRLGLVALVLAGCPSRSMNDAMHDGAKAFDTAFRRLQTIELTDAQSRVTALGAAGQAFQAELAELRRRQGEVNDLIVKGVELKKQGELEQKTATVDEAIRVFREADSKGQKLSADLAAFHVNLTAAGAPPVEARPARDPNARD